MIPVISPAFASSLAMIAAFALLLAGGWLLRRGQEKMRGILMIVMAIVLIANVLIWSLPTHS